VPPSLALLGVEDFIKALPGLDSNFAQRVAQARAAGKALRYAAAMDDGGVAVGPVAVPSGGALGSLRGRDNLLAISSKYYPDLPLVLQGSGDGIEAAASAVQGDLIALILAENSRRG
jgi:aspartokinase/homoserine dehydrogenase 1